MIAASATLDYQARGAVDGYLASAGLSKRRHKTLGFGPFTMFQRNLFPAPLAIKIHHGLQRLADRGVPGFSSTGMFYLVLAEKR